MNAEHQDKVDRVEKLLALPPSEWATAEYAANDLIEALVTDFGDEHPIVQKLNKQFNDAHEAHERWRRETGGDGRAGSVSKPVGDAKLSPTPSLSPQLPAVELPSVDPTLLKDSSPLGAAVRAIVEADRFELRRRLQAGEYSAGYSALDRKTSAHVVVKLPTDANNAWSSRFKECDDALVVEAEILPLASKAIARTPDGSARPVEHIDAGSFSIREWPYPIHWLAQRFARGSRVSELIPMRDVREHEGVRILSQVTTMVKLLYAANLAHRDLKEDALFWNGTQVEVIDWNRATQTPDGKDRQREFAALQRLTSTIFFGSAQAWGNNSDGFANESHSIASELLVTFTGLPLSRGARMLLLRTLIAEHPAAITTLEDLHTAVSELLVQWDQPSTVRPVAGDSTPRALAAVLDLVAVEIQRPAGESLAPAERLNWLVESYTQARAEATRLIRTWLSVPEDLRASFLKLEKAWYWLPDVWPLAILVPLSKLWFLHIDSKRDSELITLASQLAVGQLDNAAATIRQIAASASPPLVTLLQRTARCIDAYLNLEKVELALKAAQPDYSTALRAIRQVREAIPFEPRTLRVLRQIEAVDQRSGRIVQLLEILDELSRRTSPSSRTQREILAALEELRVLGHDDPHYSSQQQTVSMLTTTEKALAETRQYAAIGVWNEVRNRLLPWHNHPDLRQVAVDLSIEIGKLFSDAESQLSRQGLSHFYGQVRQALAEGDLALAQRLSSEARQTSIANLPIDLEVLDEALSKLADSMCQLQDGGAAGMTALKPEDCPVVCYPLLQQINAIIQTWSELDKARSVEEVRRALNNAQHLPLHMPPVLLEVRRRLVATGSARVVELLTKALSGSTALTEEEIYDYETALSQVQTDECGAGLVPLTTQLLIAQQREQRLEKRLDRVRSELTDTLDTTNSQLSMALRKIGELETKVGEVTSRVAALPDTVWNYVLWVDNTSQLSKNIQTINERLEGLTRKDGRINQNLSASRADSSSADQWGGKAVSSPVDEETRGSSGFSWKLWVGIGVAVIAIVLFSYTAFSLITSRINAVSTTTPVATTVVREITPATIIVATDVPSITASTVEPTAEQPSSEVTTAPETGTTAESTPPDNTLVAQLGQPIILPTGSGDVAGAGGKLEIGSQSVPLELTSGTEGTSVVIPETLLLSNNLEFVLPLDASLHIGDQTLPLRIEPSVLTVSNVVEKDQETRIIDNKPAAYLWHNNNIGTLPNDAVKLKGVDEAIASYAVLVNGDQVKLLEGKGDFYKIAIVSNQIDVEKAVGQIGWIRKSLVHSSGSGSQ